MPEHTLQEKKKIEQMAFESEQYGLKTQVTSGEVGNYVSGGNFKEKEEVKRKLRDLFLVDTRTAEELKDSFPELYAEAQKKKDKLETRANRSGIAKAFTDITGKKKQKAQAKLDEIESEKGKLWRERRAFDADAVHFTRKEVDIDVRIENRKHEIETELATATGLRKKMLEKALRALNSYGGKGKTSLFEKYDALQKATDYAAGLSGAQDVFFQQKVITGSDDELHSYENNNQFRDVARFTTAYGHADQADPALMLEVAKSMYVMRNGSTIEAHVEKKQVGKVMMDVRTEATVKEQRDAFFECQHYIEIAYNEMKQFEQAHPQIYTDSPSPAPEVIMANFEEFNEMYKKSQVIDYVAGDMAKSKILARPSDAPDGLSLTKEQKEHFMELRNYTAFTNKYTQVIVAKFKAWSQYFGKIPGATMPVWEEVQTLAFLRDKYKVQPQQPQQ